MITVYLVGGGLRNRPEAGIMIAGGQDIIAFWLQGFELGLFPIFYVRAIPP